METYGEVAKDAVRLLNILAKYSPLRSKRDFMRHAHSRLAVCLQQSNANIAQACSVADTDELESHSAITLHAAAVHAQREGDAAAEHLPPFRHVYPQADIASPAASTDDDDSSSSDSDSNSSSKHTSCKQAQLPAASASHPAPAALGPRAMSREYVRRCGVICTALHMHIRV